MNTTEIETVLCELGKSGCYGNFNDYLAWIKASGIPGLRLEEFEELFKSLIKSGKIKEMDRTTPTYKYNCPLAFARRVEYDFSSKYEHFPIQMARTRLESFLLFHHVNEDSTDLILIGATEGFENAVKYNSGTNFKVCYWLDDDSFNMIVENDMRFVSVEDNIAAGKFEVTTSLMRGMLVMNKVFDYMDLNFLGNNEHAVLVVKKNL